MNSRYAQSKIEYIDLLFSYFNAVELDEELSSHISKYLTVLISGIYEDIIKNLVKEFIQNETITKETKNFIFRQIDFILRNPTHKNIKIFLNRFNKYWIRKLNEKIDDEKWDALNSIVSNKNNIAHGNPCIITYDNIKKYYNDSKQIILELDLLILSNIS